MTIEFQDTLKQIESKYATITSRVNKQLDLVLTAGNTTSTDGSIDDFLTCNGLIPAGWTDLAEGDLGVELSFDGGTTWAEAFNIAGATAELGGLLFDADDIALVASAERIRFTSAGAAAANRAFTLRCKG